MDLSWVGVAYHARIIPSRHGRIRAESVWLKMVPADGADGCKAGGIELTGIQETLKLVFFF